MSNKTDQFIGFDPTRSQGSSCCGKVVWDLETQTWKQREEPPATAPAPDCSQVQAQLDQANATIADLTERLNNAEQQARDLQVQLDACTQRANALQEQLDAQPTVCEILAQHLDPVKRLNGEVIWYGLKNAEGCPDLDTLPARSLGGVEITTVAP